MRMLEYDPFDKYICCWLKNWVRQSPLPSGGKERLLSELRQPAQTTTTLIVRLLQATLWLIHYLVLVPLDYLLSLLAYSAENDVQLDLYHSRLDLSLAVRAMTNNTISHGMEIFTYIT